jgi:hypothetical protein
MLEEVAEGYRAMDERRAIKTLLWPGANRPECRWKDCGWLDAPTKYEKAAVDAAYWHVWDEHFYPEQRAKSEAWARQLNGPRQFPPGRFH